MWGKFAWGKLVVARFFDVVVFFFKLSAESVFFTDGIMAVGGLVGIGAAFFAEVNTDRVSKEGRVDNF